MSNFFDNINLSEFESLMNTNNLQRLKFYTRELFVRQKNLQNENTRLITALNMNENKLEDRELEIQRKESYIIKLQTDISKLEHKIQNDINISKTEIKKLQGDINLLKMEIEMKNSLVGKKQEDNDNLKKYNVFLMDQIKYLQGNNILVKNEIKSENVFENYEGSSNEINHFLTVFNNYEKFGEYKSQEHD
ncbi:10113_t:CDS:1 [Scutellospora calospora]|uniref:10113_t:CDS:1 n=1 Tax=Scutellospora calospora TaxID=85575 RepID=A0ACA9NP60_9GLOM|nr:10113_t:CDS:1 [Scutellospora calospora]